MKGNKKAPRKPAEVSTARIGFVGAGRIASAIINGLVVYAKVEPKRILVAAPSTNNTDLLKQTYAGIRVSRRNIDVFGRFDSDVSFICVNGNVIRNLYKLGGSRPAPLTTNFIPNMKHQIFLLSLVNGYSLATIKQCLLNPEHPEKYKIEAHRVVMNCSVAYGMGVCCIDVEPDSANLAELLRSLISTIAKLEYLPEGQMDAACAVVGAGLAFCYYFINAISDGALKIGLSRANAIKFTAKVALVSAQTLLETNKHPNELKDESCSPSGGAIYGLSVLDKADVASGISAAIEAAFKRAQSLSSNENESLKTT